MMPDRPTFTTSHQRADSVWIDDPEEFIVVYSTLTLPFRESVRISNSEPTHSEPVPVRTYLLGMLEDGASHLGLQLNQNRIYHNLITEETIECVSVSAMAHPDWTVHFVQALSVMLPPQTFQRVFQRAVLQLKWYEITDRTRSYEENPVMKEGWELIFRNIQRGRTPFQCES